MIIKWTTGILAVFAFSAFVVLDIFGYTDPSFAEVTIVILLWCIFAQINSIREQAHA